MRRQGQPVLITADGEGRTLEQFDLRDREAYDEDWIQALIHAHPTVLPIWDIEPAFTPALPVCRELPLPAGFVDNLLVSPNGNLTLVECKLWRNPEARRKVVAQIIDYVKDRVDMDYEAFEAAALGARGSGEASLYDVVNPDIDESQFVDAVSRNLARGRALLIIAGDGVTESVERMAEYLQQYAGIHFNLALVQLHTFKGNGAERIVVPSIPLRTSTIVRGIVEVADGQARVLPPSDTPQAHRGVTLTEEELFAALDSQGPRTSNRLLALIEQGSDAGQHIVARKSLIVRLPLGETYANLLVISSNGWTDTSYVWWLRDVVGEAPIRAYFEDMIAAIPGAAFRETLKGATLGWVLVVPRT